MKLQDFGKLYYDDDVKKKTWPQSFVKWYINDIHKRYCNATGDKCDLEFVPKLQDASWVGLFSSDINGNRKIRMRLNPDEDKLSLFEFGSLLNTYFHEQYHCHDFCSGHNLVDWEDLKGYQMNDLASRNKIYYECNYRYLPFEIKASKAGLIGGFNALQHLGVDGDVAEKVILSESTSDFSNLFRFGLAKDILEDKEYSLEDLSSTYPKTIDEAVDLFDKCSKMCLTTGEGFPRVVPSYDFESYLSKEQGLDMEGEDTSLDKFMRKAIQLNNKCISRFSFGPLKKIFSMLEKSSNSSNKYEADRIFAAINTFYMPSVRDEVKDGRWSMISMDDFKDIHKILSGYWNSLETDYFMSTMGMDYNIDNNISDNNDFSAVSDYETSLNSAQSQAVEMGLSGGASSSMDVGFDMGGPDM